MTMPLANHPIFDQKNLQNIDDVLLALERLGHDLPRVELARLDNFNKTYLIITRNVRQQLKLGRFEHPGFLNSFDRRFAYYYLQALQCYLQKYGQARSIKKSQQSLSKPGNTSVPKAWRSAFLAAKSKFVSPFICMALGVNAHVNNDIPQVLLDCRAQPEHYRDYASINRVIHDSLDEVMILFEQSSGRFGPNRRLLRPLYVLIMKQLIKFWRHSAWRRFEKLQRSATNREAIERKAGWLSWAISRLPV